MSIIEDDPCDGSPAPTASSESDPWSGVPAGTPDPAVAEPARPEKATPPPPAAADLRKLLRTKMAALLQSRSRYSKGAHERAEATSRQTLAEFRALAMPATEDPAALRDYLSALEERYRQHMKSMDAVDEANLAFARAEYAWQKSCSELSVAVTQAGACEELAKDDVYLAARHMNTRLAPPPKSMREKPTEPPLEQAELTDAEKAQVAALKESTFAAVQEAAQALKLGPAVLSAVKAVKATVCPDTEPPVRPTEEEIQRYLRQTETAVINRQRAHHALPALLSARTSTLGQLEASQNHLSAAIDLVKAIARASRRAESAPALAAAGLLLQILHTAHNGLGDGYNADHLEKTQRKTTSRRETRQINEMRDMMRQLAFFRGSLNEAKVTLNVAKAGRDRTVELCGVAEAKTWQACLDWHSQKATEQRTSERVNLSRKTKVELLTELVAQHERDAAAAATALYRYVMAIKPPDERPPSDEFKVVVNTAAWLCNPEANGHNRSRPGDFPIY